MPSETDNQVEKTLKSLKGNKFDARLASNGETAKKLALDLLPREVVVGIGDSATLRHIGVIKKIEERGTKVVNPFVKELTVDPKKHPLLLDTLRKTHRCDIFMTSANAVTLNGKVVSVDRAGNRVAGMIFGAPRVILIIGRNKIVGNVEEALDRIRNVIAPTHQKRKERKTPCVKTGKCEDCNAPDRACNVTVILEKCPLLTDLTIILVDEDLGLGWDPSWSEKRIESIRDEYYSATWAFKGISHQTAGKN